MTTYGLWIKEPGKYTGWHGLAWDDTFTPWTFENKVEAETRAARWMGNVPGSSVEVRQNPPAKLPWNEEAWLATRV